MALQLWLFAGREAATAVHTKDNDVTRCLKFTVTEYPTGTRKKNSKGSQADLRA